MDDIFFIFYDPKPDGVRIENMLTDAAQSKEFAKDFGRPNEIPLYTKGLGPKGRSSKAAFEIMNTTSKQQPNWSDCILKISASQDQAAFAALFRHFAPRVKSFLMKSGASDTMAEEVTQETMATVWRKAHMFDPTRAGASTWIFTIARNRKIDVLRKQRRPEPEDLTWGPEAEPSADDAMVLQQETVKLTQALHALPDAQRDLVQRAYFGDLSHTEIAEQTGLPLGTIKSRLRLALERLRRTMK